VYALVLEFYFLFCQNHALHLQIKLIDLEYSFLKELPKQIETYTEKIRKTKNETILANLDGGTVAEILEKEDDLPF
jgi:NAD+--asparagine ADP-ribosyltransferase